MERTLHIVEDYTVTHYEENNTLCEDDSTLCMEITEPELLNTLK